jgi:hypothetical protein
MQYMCISSNLFLNIMKIKHLGLYEIYPLTEVRVDHDITF